MATAGRTRIGPFSGPLLGGNPVEELNLAERDRFYGHNPAKYGQPTTTDPLHVLRTEVAPAGIAFNAVDNDFGGTGGDLFVAFYGPGERWSRGAIGRVRLSRAEDGTYRSAEYPVATGLPKLSDVAFGADGNLYATHVGMSDYWYQPLDEPDGAIYRIFLAPWIVPTAIDSVDSAPLLVSSDVLVEGEQIFVDRACSACHAVDGKAELLGPNLKDIGRVYSREELLEEIQEPSLRIKPSMDATRLTLRSGEVLLGRVVGSDAEQVRLIVVGNRILDVARANIEREEPVAESLMWSGLLSGLTDEQVDALLSYLISLGEAND